MASAYLGKIKYIYIGADFWERFSFASDLFSDARMSAILHFIQDMKSLRWIKTLRYKAKAFQFWFCQMQAAAGASESQNTSRGQYSWSR